MEKISIVAPMFNESENVYHSYKAIKTEIEKTTTNYEIIFVNDGSTDNTLEIAQKISEKDKKLKVVGYFPNQGRGKALRTGTNASTGDIICTIDFDLSYKASHITHMIKTLQQNEIVDTVLVSAYMPGGKTIGVPKFRLFISKLGNYIYRNAFSQKIYTSTCVVRAYRKEAIKNLLLESDDKEIHLEIISKLLANGNKIVEIPGILEKRKGGKSKFKFRGTSVSHFIYFIQEKPMILFGFLGGILLFLGVISSIITLSLRLSEHSIFTDTIFGKIASPNFVIILILSGFQMLGLGFLGIQNTLLKKELFRIQKQIKKGQ